jgi:ComF family protein
MRSQAAALSRPVWRRLRQEILELLFPTRCVGCRSLGRIWCDACQGRLVPVPTPVCLACRQTLVPHIRRHSCPDSSTLAWAAARYQAPLDRALTHLKYKPDARLVEIFAGTLGAVYERAGARATCIVGVPLGPQRLRRRGYNQTDLLGRALSETLRLPFYPSAVSRIRETASQVGLDPKERWANVEGAFQGDPSIVAGQAVLLIDDVHTTGATLSACAAALTQAGAWRVVAVTVGRA